MTFKEFYNYLLENYLNKWFLDREKDIVFIHSIKWSQYTKPEFIEINFIRIIIFPSNETIYINNNKYTFYAPNDNGNFLEGLKEIKEVPNNIISFYIVSQTLYDTINKLKK